MKRKRASKPPVIATATIEKYAHDGRGLARISGKTTFIAGALPDETVEFEYTRRKSDYDEGRVLTVLESSPERVEPDCPHYVMCGGCSFQHVAPEAQITIKQGILLELLERVGHCKPLEVLPPLNDQVWHYRHKARLSVRYVEKKAATLIGFREKKNPRYITDIHQCPVLHADVDAQIDVLRALLDGMDDKRCIAQIEVAAGDTDVALIFRNLEPLTPAAEAQLQAFGAQSQFRLYLQPAGPDSVTLFYPPDADEYLRYALPEFDVVYHFHPTDFTQVNTNINRKMVSLALKWLDLQASDTVLDLFCGLGNFSLPIAQRCARVIGIEGSDKMITRAQMNAEANQITNATFACANLEEWPMTGALVKGVTKILLDPPRSGALAIVKQMHLIRPEIIVYVSCNPITLARDAEVLVSTHGYTLQAAGVMDMFPHTAHVESIAIFVKG
ncbi:MAG: 23S rRNA (uracil(1939)-C(5))-methyltransferase RlmD [Gammaproteobacteria bacterium]|nr:23S rRNA (uracil(1939)-C(5))-methyltransferase RlmD [Gammaproteobacteria bacterium]